MRTRHRLVPWDTTVIDFLKKMMLRLADRYMAVSGLFQNDKPPRSTVSLLHEKLRLLLLNSFPSLLMSLE